jgi:hypothetical protein
MTRQSHHTCQGQSSGHNRRLSRYVCSRECALPLEHSIETPLSLILIEQAKGVVKEQSTPKQQSKMKVLLDSRKG